MIYENIRPGRFISRPNRFIAHVEVDGQVEICHVKNTGRCRELLVPGARVFVQKSDKAGRKTGFDLISVQKRERLINMDSSAPNRVFAQWLAGNVPAPELIRPETRFEDSRFDFYIEAGGRPAFVEVKGVTLEADGIVRFPDAPTQRGVRHLQALVRCLEAGYDAWAVFIVQMKGVRYLEPNDLTHPEFGAALREATSAGVRLLALDCEVTEDSIVAGDFVEIRL